MLACGRITDTTPPAVVTGLRGPWAADSTWFEVKKRAGRRGVRVMANRVDGEESVVERENQSGDFRVKSLQVCVGFGVKKVPRVWLRLKRVWLTVLLPESGVKRQEDTASRVCLRVKRV